LIRLAGTHSHIFLSWFEYETLPATRSLPRVEGCGRSRESRILLRKLRAPAKEAEAGPSGEKGGPPKKKAKK